MIGFLGVLEPEDQARIGIPWVATTLLTAPGDIANHSFLISSWLINVRSGALNVCLMPQWQQMVDALVEAGVARLAPYSE